MEKQIKKTVKISLIFLAIGLLLGTLIVFAATPSSTFYISSGVYPGAPSYTVWREGSNYFAKDENGQLKYSGTDARSVINNATNDAGEGGLTFLKNADYLITGGRVWLNHTGASLIGESRDGTKIIQTDASHNAMTTYQNNTYFAHFTVDTKTYGAVTAFSSALAWNVTLYDLCILGPTNHFAVYFAGPTDKGASKDNLLYDHYNKILNCIVQSDASEVDVLSFCYQKGGIIDGCTVRGRLIPYVITECQIVNNHITGNGHGIWITPPSSHVLVANNIIEGVTSEAIGCASPSGGNYWSSYITITGNTIIESRGIVCAYTENSVVSSNTLLNITGGSGIYLHHGNHSIVADNVIVHCAEHAINFYTVSYSIISNNVIKWAGQQTDNTFYDIRLNNEGGNYSQYNLIEGNNIYASGSAKTAYAIREVTTRCNYTLAIANMIVGTHNGISLQSVDSVQEDNMYNGSFSD